MAVRRSPSGWAQLPPTHVSRTRAYYLHAIIFSVPAFHPGNWSYWFSCQEPAKRAGNLLNFDQGYTL